MSKHSQDVPAPSRVGADFGPEAEPSAGCSGATPRAADSLRELHLFAGAGGGILGGMLLGHTPVCAVEIDKYCRRVLGARQADGCLPPFPVFADIRAFDGRPWRGRVDVVAGGFPCQPWSQAGKQKGADDPRHLWPEMARIVEEVRPRYVFAENVSLAALEEPWRDLRGLGQLSASLRQMLARRTSASGGGSWPTPKSSYSGPDYNRVNRQASGGDDLVTAVARAEQIPTPTAGDAKNARNATSSRHRDSQHHSGTTLCDLVHATGGKLNPQWVEWLMGWPIGWTDCAPLATDRCQWPQRPLGTT